MARTFLFGRLGHACRFGSVGTHPGEVPVMARTTQRDVMRDLNRRLVGDREKVVAPYAAAERHGKVSRPSNVRGMEAEEYAERLYQDGVAKGWIR